MCELLGLSFNLKISPNISFSGFQLRGKPNPHGWGIGLYPDKSGQVFKEPIRADRSLLAEFIKDYSEIESKIFTAHVRYSSSGSTIHSNTHPFMREFQGRNYIFAHNGTLKNFKELELGRFLPIGETDSEYVFCHLLQLIEDRNIESWGKQDFGWLQKQFLYINQLGTFNCLFSDGEILVSYHDLNGHKGLHFVKREAPFPRIQLKDMDWEINLPEVKDQEQKGYIVATHPLTDENWESFCLGKIRVFRDGDVIYSNSENQN